MPSWNFFKLNFFLKCCNLWNVIDFNFFPGKGSCLYYLLSSRMRLVLKSRIPAIYFEKMWKGEHVFTVLEKEDWILEKTAWHNYPSRIEVCGGIWSSPVSYKKPTRLPHSVLSVIWQTLLNCSFCIQGWTEFCWKGERGLSRSKMSTRCRKFSASKKKVSEL